MRRAGRILYNLLTTISLLFLLATVTVWVRSYWVSDRLQWFTWSRMNELWEGKLLCWSRGGVRFNVGLYPASKKDVLPYPARFEHHREPPLDYPAYGVKWFQETYPWGRRYAGLGFEWISQTGKGERLFFPSTLIRSVTLPLYFPTLVFALLPAHNFLRTRRRRRRGKCIAQNHCRACNYDLRASPDRCPECGLAVPAPSKADLKN